LSHDTRGTTDVAGDVVPVDETDGEIDVREFDGRMNSVSPGDKTDWRLKTPSSVCRTNTSPDKIYLLAKKLESLGSMLCLSARSQKGGEQSQQQQICVISGFYIIEPKLKDSAAKPSRVYSLSAPYTLTMLLHNVRRRALHNTRCG